MSQTASKRIHKRSQPALRSPRLCVSFTPDDVRRLAIYREREGIQKQADAVRSLLRKGLRAAGV